MGNTYGRYERPFGKTIEFTRSFRIESSIGLIIEEEVKPYVDDKKGCVDL